MKSSHPCIDFFLEKQEHPSSYLYDVNTDIL